MSSVRFADRLGALQALLEPALRAALEPAALAETRASELDAAMAYSLLAGGKRVRPVLSLLFCEALCGEPEPALPFGCALECVHTYSLIHDDLPALDDDDLRRGRPSNHKVYGEALAMLAGDGLLTLAFELCARLPDPERARACTLELARAAGPWGMVGGQTLDLRGEGRTSEAPDHTEAFLSAIHRGKTAALIRAACVGGAILGGATGGQRQAAARYGEAVGLLFQVTDDILDETATTEELGKTAGKDARAGKLTYPALLGVEGARARAVSLCGEARTALEGLPPSEARDHLDAFAAYVRDRSR